MEESELRTYSPLSLAFLGDAVLSLFIREYLVRKGNAQPGKLHAKAVKYVSAEAQSAAMSVLASDLSEEEQQIYRRGRNAKTGSGAKNASRKAYHDATGLESLLGWLYLKGDKDRMNRLMNDFAAIVEESW